MTWSYPCTLCAACGASFTIGSSPCVQAGVYINCFYDYQLCAGVLQSSRAVVDQLLLDIYSSINEPDGIYAVARGHSMMSQLKLYEHEGSWDKALTGYDLLCRRPDAATASAASSSSLLQPVRSSGVPDGSSAYGQQGLLTSLQQLGCRHLIEAYWQGQPGPLSAGWSLSSFLKASMSSYAAAPWLTHDAAKP